MLCHCLSEVYKIIFLLQTQRKNAMTTNDFLHNVKNGLQRGIVLKNQHEIFADARVKHALMQASNRGPLPKDMVPLTSTQLVDLRNQ